MHHPLIPDHSLIRETVPQRWLPEVIGSACKKVCAPIQTRRKQSHWIL